MSPEAPQSHHRMTGPLHVVVIVVMEGTAAVVSAVAPSVVEMPSSLCLTKQGGQGQCHQKLACPIPQTLVGPQLAKNRHHLNHCQHRRHLGGACGGTDPPTFPHYVATNATLLFPAIQYC